MKIFTQKISGVIAFLLLALSVSAQPPFWSEDFDGGLPADWTAIKVAGNDDPSANWIWTDSGPGGAFAVAPIMSTTSANGWMIFDSDLNCSGNQHVRLVSPKLNLTGKPTVFLRFQQFFRKWHDQINVQVSVDSTVWTQFPLSQMLTNSQFGDGSNNGTNNPQIVTLDLSAQFGNKPTVWIAFQHIADPSTATDPAQAGCAYSWQIDDVGLLDYDPTPSTNMAIGDFFYPPLSFATPTSQIATDTMGFSADISNVGNSDIPNVVLKATVTNQAGAILFQDSVVAAVLPKGTVDSTYVIPNLYPPATDVGVYTISYEVYSLDSLDFDLSNNSASEDYVVTESIWSKESAATIAYRPGGGPTDYDIGNLYTTSNDWVEPYYATTVDFTAATNAADGPLANFFTSIILLEVDESLVLPDWSNFDDALNYLTNEGLIIRSFELHQYAGANFSEQSVNLTDFDLETPGVELKPGNRYILLASYENENNVVFHAFSEEISYFQISTVIFNGQWFLGGFGPDPAAVLRMSISIDVATEDVLPASVMSLYPNPVKDQLNLDLAFDKPELVNVTIANLDGKVIQMDVVKNTVQETRQYNVSNLPAGTYLIRVTTEEGSRTEKFVVVR